jgi:DNA topoisomerase-2
LNCDGCYNINLLIPRGQFSSRRQGGSDAGRSRYLYCQLNFIASPIIRHEDNMCIVHCEDDGQH